MIKNYIKIAWRNLLKNKTFSFINIIGLALGIAITLIIALWVGSELKYDRFYSHTDHLYQVFTRDKFEGEQHTWGGTPMVLGPILQQEHPEIEEVVRVWNVEHNIHQQGNTGFKSSGIAGDSSFFKLFDFDFITGNSNSPLSRPDGLVITQSMAMKLFGNTDVIGKRLQMDSVASLTVEAVIQDIPMNSKFHGNDFFCSMNYLAKNGQTFSDSWTAYNIETYTLLKAGVDLNTTNKNIEKLVSKHTKGQTNAQIYLHPANRWHLYNKSVNGEMVAGNLITIRMFSLIGFFILLIAGINFVNLSTAAADKRSKEVGVRKVIGAPRKSLIYQFLTESFILTLIAGCVAIVIIALVLPFFNTIVQNHVSISADPALFAILFMITLLACALGAGVYPAFVLSSFQPIKALKGATGKLKSGLKPREVLVTLQFTISICLVICTLIVGQQIEYGQDRNSGYESNNLVYLPIEGGIGKNYELIRRELLDQGIALHVSKTWGRITRNGSNSWGYSWANSKPEDYDVVFNNMSSDADFSKTMGVALVAGRDIDVYTYPSDSTALLLNEAAVKRMGLQSPIGAQVITAKGTPYQQIGTVVGVVQDFIFQSPYANIEPLMIQGPSAWFDYIHIRLNHAQNLLSNVKAIKAIFQKYNPNYPLDLQFADDAYALKFVQQQRMAKLTAIFSSLAIFIACLGLFGMVSFATIQRQKEIGIRKVLGASISGIIQMLSQDFIKLVFIATIIASPIAWWIMNQWLADFTYRTTIHWWIFALSGIVAIIIALLTISSLAFKAARANPVDSLRDE